MTAPPKTGKPRGYLLNEQEKRKFVAVFMARYGVALDVNDEFLPLYFISYQAGVITEKNVAASAEQLVRTMTDFEKFSKERLSKSQPKMFRFSSPKEAFWFALGWLAIPAICISFLLFLGWCLYRFQEQKEEQATLATTLIANGKITTRKLSQHLYAKVLILHPASTLDSAQVGESFIYRKECNCIEVPLSYQQD